MKHIALSQIIAPAELRRAGDNRYPVLSMTMRDGLVNQADKFKKRIASTDTSPYKVVERGQLVVGFPIDEGVLAFQNIYNKAIVSPAYSVWNLQSSRSINSRFLEQFLRSPRALTFYRSKLQNTAARRRTLSNDVFLSLSVPVPPLAEQDRIVKFLDQADELRSLRAQCDGRTDELIPALFDEMFGSTKHVKALNELADVVSGVAKGRKFKGARPITVQYVRVANVQAGYLDLTHLKTIEALPDEVGELSLKRGDVLMTEGGDIDKLGRGAMLDRDLPNCIHQNHVFRVRCEPSQLLPEYFATFLLSANARLYFRRCAKKTSNLASINMSQLRALPVPAPSLSLQKEFAQRVKEIRELESAQARSRARLNALYQSLVHRAFNGAL